jgi:hypothetical protein
MPSPAHLLLVTGDDLLLQSGSGDLLLLNQFAPNFSILSGGEMPGPLIRSEPSTVDVLEKETPLYTATLTDDSGAILPAATLQTLTLLLYIEKADGTHSYIRGSAGVGQNVLNTNNVTIDSTGLLTWKIQVADTTLNDQTVPFERHVGLWTWTWTDAGGSARRGSHELVLTVKNLSEV